MKRRIEENKICPQCGKKENQIKIEFNCLETQRCKYKDYGIRYTLEPKKHEYSEEIK